MSTTPTIGNPDLAHIVAKERFGCFGPVWCRLFPAAAKMLKQDREAAAYDDAAKARDAKRAEFITRKGQKMRFWSSMPST